MRWEGRLALPNRGPAPEYITYTLPVAHTIQVKALYHHLFGGCGSAAGGLGWAGPNSSSMNADHGLVSSHQEDRPHEQKSELIGSRHWERSPNPGREPRPKPHPVGLLRCGRQANCLDDSLIDGLKNTTREGRHAGSRRWHGSP